MPFGDRPHHRDLATNAGLVDDPAGGANQSAPLLLSNRGRHVWSERPFEFTVTPGRLDVRGSGLRSGTAPDASLAAAFRTACGAHFPPTGRTPARSMVVDPQYNTWIEMPFTPTQRRVLDYVEGLLDAGFPPGLVMIDDLWAQDYGTWRFDRAAFPDPTAMVTRLHEQGCRVMLWVVPFVSPDSATFRRLERRDLLIRRPDGAPAVRRWWNGYSAMLDLTNPDAVAWLHGELDALRHDHGVDGFKFDAGDLRDYRTDDVTHRTGAQPVDLCEAWARIGQRYPYNEFRACWKSGGAPLAQRLHDKPSTWEALATLIPESIAQGLIGHPFVCPDMVGGGDLGATGHNGIDQELFVRYAQVAALHPMMQFSLAPQRVLDTEHLAAVHAALALRERLMPDLLALVDHAAATGEPILRPLAWADPDDAGPADEFLLGDDILVAPVLEPGARVRPIRFPPGDWAAEEGSAIHGPTRVDLPVGLPTLPRFRRV